MVIYNTNTNKQAVAIQVLTMNRKKKIFPRHYGVGISILLHSFTVPSLHAECQTCRALPAITGWEFRLF